MMFCYLEPGHQQQYQFLTCQTVITKWWEIDIHGCYSLERIAFATISMCKSINENDFTMPVSRIRVTSQIKFGAYLNAKSEKTVLDNYGKMSDPWLCSELCVQDIKYRVKNKIMHSFPWITIFRSRVRWFANNFHKWRSHEWKSLTNRITDIHGNSHIFLYFW